MPQRSDRLLWQAEPALVLATQLRCTTLVADIARLRDKIALMLRDFQAGTRANGVDAIRVARAIDVLDALFDQVVASMPWGADSGWRSLGASRAVERSLRPAQRVLNVAAASSADPGMLELIGVAVSLGFDKRGRGADAAPLDELLARVTPREAPAAAGAGAPLSPDLPSQPAREPVLTRWLPLWVSSFVVAALLAAVYFGLVLSLGARSDRLYARLAAVPGPSAAVAPPQPAIEPRLAGILADSPAANRLFVHDYIDRSTIIVPDSSLFEPGEPALKSSSVELLRPIVAALKLNPGRVEVIGHTDGSLQKSARYPSDWELSVDRARAVRDALRDLGLDSTRLRYDGRGSIEPAAADGTRAVSGDGRIEIILLAGR